MFLCRRIERASFPNIGRQFNRDHTTIIHACRTVEANWAMLRDAQDIIRKLVDSGDSSTISKNLGPENAIEQSVKTQAESMAA
jgi:hypothetical protein